MSAHDVHVLSSWYQHHCLSPDLSWHGKCCYADDFLPGEGNTIETGRGLRTGGRSLSEVGQMLFRLLGTMVACYTAHEDDGAYTVWLPCPSKVDQLCSSCCSSHITRQHISRRSGL